MSPLNFLQHLFTLRAIERELADEKVRTKQLEAVLQTVRQKHEAELQIRDTTINKLRQENKELNDLLHARPPIVESDFDPRKF